MASHNSGSSFSIFARSFGLIPFFFNPDSNAESELTDLRPVDEKVDLCFLSIPFKELLKCWSESF
jgi:hypothetical protein